MRRPSPPVRRLLFSCLAAALIGLAWWATRYPLGPSSARAGYLHDPPYMFQGPGGRPQGLDIDVMREAATRAGITLTWVYLPAPGNADRALRDGVVDIWPALTILPSRTAEFSFTDPWLRTEVWVVVRDGTTLPPPSYDGPIGLSPLPVTAFVVQKHFPRARQMAYRDGAALAHAMCDGEVDVGLLAAGDLAQALAGPDARCRQANLRPFVVPESTLRIAVAARAGYAGTAARLRAQIDAMAADGSIRSIVLPYSFHAATEILAVYEILQARARVRLFTWGTVVLGVVLVATLILFAALTRANRRARQSLIEKAALEQQLQAAQRLELLGQFAGGIAHDFNNLVTVIVGYAAISADRAATDPVLADALSEIRRAADRATDLVRQLLAFGRDEVVEPRVIGLHHAVDALTPMLRHVLRGDIHLELALGADHDRVLLDDGQLSRVLLNLTINARDAMPQGGTIRISTSNETTATGAPTIMLSLADTGVGMTPEVQARAFEPFFTTKEAGRGTGLGLSAVHSLVRQAGGTIALQSRPGMGTRFDLVLPVVVTEAQVTQTGPADPVADPVVRPHDVLVVEDQRDLRDLVGRVLRAEGYRVFEAADGAQALQILREHQGAMSLVLTDVRMPHLSGLGLQAEVAQTMASVPFLFMSGQTDDGSLPAAASHGVLAKPFTPAQLRAAVADALAQKRPVA
jgi:signal transduction histidine kinase